MLNKHHLEYIKSIPVERLIYFLENKNIEQMVTLLQNINKYIESKKSMLTHTEKHALLTLIPLAKARGNAILQEYNFEGGGDNDSL